MKLHGVVRGTTIELEANPELPDGQRVLVELEIPITESNTEPISELDLESRIASDPDFASIRQARSLRERIATRLSGKLLNSVELIREDRTR